MTLLQRIQDILTANVHDLVDRLEDPEKMLRQAVREIDACIAAITSAAARSIAGQRLLEREIERQQSAADRSRAAAVDAVTAGDDAAARSALERRREQEQLLRVLDEQRSAARESAEKLRRRRGALEIKRAEAARLLIELTSRQGVAGIQSRLGTIASLEAANEALRRFDRLRQRLEFAEWEADALGSALNEEEWEQRGGAAETAIIDAELLEIKRHLKA